MAPLIGLKPITFWVETRRSIQLSYRGIGTEGKTRTFTPVKLWILSPVCLPFHHFGILERVERIELSSSAWKAEALPLCYTRLEQKGGTCTHHHQVERYSHDCYLKFNHTAFLLECCSLHHFLHGASRMNRTPNIHITNMVLYQLSYRGSILSTVSPILIFPCWGLGMTIRTK
jgi:hypothetical protein